MDENKEKRNSNGSSNWDLKDLNPQTIKEVIKEEIKSNKEINKLLREERQKKKKEIVLLLLGNFSIPFIRTLKSR
jgi:hypothetical protein